jgi:hypothetical protein
VVGAVLHAVRIKVAAGEVGAGLEPGLRIKASFVGGFGAAQRALQGDLPHPRTRSSARKVSGMTQLRNT